MKLSVELHAIRGKFGDYKAIEMAKEAGFDAIDYSYYGIDENEEVLGDRYKEYAESLRTHLDKIGIECNQAHAPFLMQYGYTFDASEQKYKEVIRSLESAAILGAENIIVHSICVPRGVDFEEYNINYYKSLIPYCEKFGIHIAVENVFIMEPERRRRLICHIGSPAELNRMVEKINSPWIVACVDIGHASLVRYEPEDFIEEMNPHILKSLHVQDNDYISDRHTLPYIGELNWEAIMTSLKKIGYKGELTFEIINYLKKFPDALVLDAMKLAVSVGRYLISLYEK